MCTDRVAHHVQFNGMYHVYYNLELCNKTLLKGWNCTKVKECSLKYNRNGAKDLVTFSTQGFPQLNTSPIIRIRFLGENVHHCHIVKLVFSIDVLNISDTKCLVFML